MSHQPRSLLGRSIHLLAAASAGLALSVVAGPLATADPAGSPTPSASASATPLPSPTRSPDPSVTSAGSESASPSVVTTPDTTTSPTPEASVTPSPRQQEPPRREPELAPGDISVSGFLRDATTGAPIPNSCVAYRPTWVTSTATNGTSRVGDKGRWEIDAGDAGPFYLAFYVTEDGDCSQDVLTGAENYRAAWYRGHPFVGTDPSTALPPPDADPVAAGSTIVACLGTHNALPTTCATPNRTASGRVVGVGPKPISQACIVAIGPNSNELGFAMTDADGRWKMTGLPINYDYVVVVVPPFRTSDGPCNTSDDGPPPATQRGALQPEFYENTWADFSDPDMRDDPFVWATDRNSPHPAVTLRNNQNGLDVCLTTETGRNTQRGSCDPPTPTITASPSPSMQPTLAATGGLSPLTLALGVALLLGAIGILAHARRARAPATA